MTSPNGCTIAIQAILLKSKKKILTNPWLKVANPALIHPYLKTTVCVSFVLGLQQFYIKNEYCKYCND